MDMQSLTHTHTHTHTCSSDVSVSDVWSKGQSEVRSFLTSCPSLGKIPSDSISYTLFCPGRHAHSHTIHAYQRKETRKKNNAADFTTWFISSVLVDECVGNTFFCVSKHSHQLFYNALTPQWGIADSRRQRDKNKSYLLIGACVYVC